MSNPVPSQLRGAVDLSSLVRRPAAPPPAGGQDAAVDSLVFEADDASFTRVLELSQTVPVVVEFIAAGLAPALGTIIRSYAGRFVLAVVDASANPQLAQAFQVREVPAVSAVIAGRPVNLFVGMPSETEARSVLDELLLLAAENGVTGTAAVPEGDAAPAEPVEEPLPPHHQEAYDAISRGDYAEAAAEYRLAIAQSPRDALAVAGLAQVLLLQRLDGVDPRRGPRERGGASGRRRGRARRRRSRCERRPSG